MFRRIFTHTVLGSVNCLKVVEINVHANLTIWFDTRLDESSTG